MGLRWLAEHPSTAILMEYAMTLDFEDVALAKKQAAWVTDQLVWDHIQERKHHGTIALPKLQ